MSKAQRRDWRLKEAAPLDPVGGRPPFTESRVALAPPRAAEA